MDWPFLRFLSHYRRLPKYLCSEGIRLPEQEEGAQLTLTPRQEWGWSQWEPQAPQGALNQLCPLHGGPASPGRQEPPEATRMFPLSLSALGNFWRKTILAKYAKCLQIDACE